jgi:outer membrane receptor protein involved in Fe transport
MKSSIYLGAKASVAVLAWAGLFAVSSVQAQEAKPARTAADGAAADATTAPEPDAAAVADIIVTGSRIAKSGYSAPTPVTVLGTADIERQAITNIGDLLNTMPSFRAQSTPATTAIFISNAGANLADLRGLGANRTLVLVDGRRFVAGTVGGGSFSPSGVTDLNAIPTVLVSRSEVVTGGASAAYGSDAVAGVVNLILDTKFEGVKGSIQQGFSERGDNNEIYGTLAFGTGFGGGRGHFIIGGEYSKSKGVGDCYTRSWCAEGYGPVANPVPQLNGLARSLILPDTHSSLAAPGGLITSGSLAGTEFLANGVDTVAHDYGTYYGVPIFQSGGNTQEKGNSFFRFYPLVAPVERISTLAHATYDFSDSFTAYVEGSFARVKATTFGAQPRELGNLTISIDNPYLPASVVSRMAAAGETTFKMGRIGNDFGPSRGRVQRETYRGVAGFKYDIGSSWKLDGYYQYGRTDYKQRGENTEISDNFGRAIDAVRDPSSGQIVCRSTLTNPGNGCSPLNIFGEGNASAASLAYAFGTTKQDTHLTQQVVALNLSGDLFQLPAGSVSLATGAEYRVEDVTGTADAISRAGRFVTSPGFAINGPAIKVKEAYAELAVPVLRDVAFAKAVDLNGAVRVTDYSTSGSVTSWKGGVTWELSDLLRLRLTRSRDIRAPNFFELYTPTNNSFQLLSNPYLGGANSLTVVDLGGNPNLRPEIANTLTAGFVLSPMRGLRMSLDYYDIKLDGAIASLGGQTLINRCFAGETEFCQYITRDTATNAITRVRDASLNLNRVKTRGFDGELTYDKSFGDNDFSLRVLGTYVLDLITVGNAGEVDRAGQNGAPVSQQSGVPTFSGNAYLTWSNDPVSLTFQARYVSKGLKDTTKIGADQKGYVATAANSINENKIPDYWVFSLNGQVDIIKEDRRSLQFFGVINNLFDRAPPNRLSTSFGVTNPVLYDVIGRTFKVGVRFSY